MRRIISNVPWRRFPVTTGLQHGRALYGAFEVDEYEVVGGYLGELA
jgi:hypothetical protein